MIERAQTPCFTKGKIGQGKRNFLESKRCTKFPKPKYNIKLIFLRAVILLCLRALLILKMYFTSSVSLRAESNSKKEKQHFSKLSYEKQVVEKIVFLDRNYRNIIVFYFKQEEQCKFSKSIGQVLTWTMDIQISLIIESVLMYFA